ncbi:MAG: NAD-dependent epimerase/dehydratase family protein [Clostridiales bacterium]|nr:NAD-dependent epimerase/dehydratase family protein [Clostridiales bacterium]
MKAVIIGGCGHIGTYLAPKLVEYGYETVAISRGLSKPYVKSGMWTWIEKVKMDRVQLEKEGVFGKLIADMHADVVVDLIGFDFNSTVGMVEALKGNVGHYLFCSSIWAHGAASSVPAPENLPRRPFGDYGINKAKSEAYLHEQHYKCGFPETVVMPGHITGPGWNFIGPCGNLDPQVFGRIGRGEKIFLPNFGMECLHNVHADDVAQVFMKSILSRKQALGESFHAVAASATTMRGIAEKMYLWFGKESNIEFLPWDKWCEAVKDPGFISSTENHVLHSDNYSAEKGRRLIGYNPRYSIFEAMCEGVTSMIERGVIKVDGL